MSLCPPPSLGFPNTRELDDMSGQVIATKAVPRGKYPHYKRSGDFIFVSGTSPRQADNTFPGADVDALGTPRFDIRAQTRATLQNISDILAAAGAGLEDVVDLSTFLVDMSDFAGYNEVYGEFFDYDGPARTTVAVHQLPHPLIRIEIKCTAYRAAKT